MTRRTSAFDTWQFAGHSQSSQKLQSHILNPPILEMLRSSPVWSLSSGSGHHTTTASSGVTVFRQLLRTNSSNCSGALPSISWRTQLHNLQRTRTFLQKKWWNFYPFPNLNLGHSVDSGMFRIFHISQFVVGLLSLPCPPKACTWFSQRLAKTS